MNSEQQQQQEQSLTQYFDQRVSSLEKLENEGRLERYPHKFHVTHQIPQFRSLFDHLSAEESLDTLEVSIAGRIESKRTASSKLVFLTINGDGQQVQVLCNAKFFIEKQNGFSFREITDLLKRGDIIGITGYPTRSKTGELSIVPTTCIQLLSPCYHNLPHPGTLTDLETRYRSRYLDMIVNTQVAQTFRTRAKIISFIRNFFNDKGYTEVETPILNIIPGGANAQPFVTHHNDLHTNMFLRIAPELYLKQCIIGGLDRVYEIGKNFRNEGVDLTHNPEYTAIETYCAYADYNDLIKTTEELLSSMVKEICGSYEIPYRFKDGIDEKTGETIWKTVNIDFKPPFARYPLIKTLEEKLNVKFPQDLASDETNQFVKDLVDKHGLVCGEPLTTVRLLDKLVGEFIEPLLINPGFITDHPQITSPLAKWHRSEPGLTERFELFVAGKELCNAYTELNSPFIQRKMFLSEQKGRDAGDEESQPVDEAFCVSLEYALPPTGGWGMGIDRLCMFLTNQQSIKEVILFPTMKPLESDRKAQKQMSATLKQVVQKISDEL